jgi:hypothetical protein
MPDRSSNRGPSARQMKVALELLDKSAERFSGIGLELLEIKLYPAYSLTCVYNQDIQVVCGLEDVDRQLQDLEWIFADAAVAGRRLATVNTMMSRNIPVTFHDAILPAAGGPASPNLRPLDAGAMPERDSDTAADLRQILRRG